MLINKHECLRLKHFENSKAFIEYLNSMDDIFENISEYNLNEKQKTLFLFDDMIANILSNKKLKPKVREFFIRGKKINRSLVFIV